MGFLMMLLISLLLILVAGLASAVAVVSWRVFAAWLAPGCAPSERTARLILRECWTWLRFHKARMARAFLRGIFHRFIRSPPR